MSQEQNGQNAKLKQYQIIIIIVAVLIILGVAAFFIIRGTQQEEAVVLQTVDTADTSEEVSATEFQVALEDVVATVNGEDVLGDDVLTSYEHVVNYYGEPDSDSIELYYAVAMEEAVTMKLISITAAEMGVDEFTDEELEEIYATSDSEWQYALDNYVSYNFTETEETTEEELAAAYAEAEEYYGLMGYTQEILRESYVENEVFERVQEELCKDVTVSEEEVQAYYDEAVAADEALYADDIDAYENQLLMYQYGYADEEPWYKPAGYRYIKHILLEVDEDLLADYTDLLALYEEQLDDEEAAEEAGETTETAEDTETTVITAEDIDAAKAAIIASVQDTIDEIYARLDAGESFDDLMAEYGTDPGMTSGSYPDGYEVSLASYSFVTEFVAAAFSVDEIGDVSEPTLSDYGVHIVLYAGDVPAGAVELTDTLYDTIYQTLMDEKCNDILNEWYDSADIQYTGIIRSVEQIQAAEAEETEDAE